MVESSMVKYKMSLIDYTVGVSSKVEFNFLRIWDIISNIPDYNSCHLLFTHVHPPGFNEYSTVDLNCMKGFEISFGGGIYFNIIIFDNDDLFSTLHIVKSYYYRNGGIIKLDLTSCLSQSELLFLKYLSYSKNLN